MSIINVEFGGSDTNNLVKMLFWAQICPNKSLKYCLLTECAHFVDFNLGQPERRYSHAGTNDLPKLQIFEKKNDVPRFCKKSKKKAQTDQIL